MRSVHTRNRSVIHTWKKPVQSLKASTSSQKISTHQNEVSQYIPGRGRYSARRLWCHPSHGWSACWAVAPPRLQSACPAWLTWWGRWWSHTASRYEPQSPVNSSQNVCWINEPCYTQLSHMVNFWDKMWHYGDLSGIVDIRYPVYKWLSGNNIRYGVVWLVGIR